MMPTINRTSSAAAATLLLVGGLAACGSDPAPTQAGPPAPAEEAPEEDPAPDENPSAEGAPPEQDDAGAGAEPAPEEDVDAGAPAPAPEEGAPEEGAPEDGAPEDGAPEDQAPEAGGVNAATYDGWLSVPLPEGWSEFEDGVWAGEDGAALHLGPCYAPDSGTLDYDACVEFAPVATEPSASDPTTEVEITQLPVEDEDLRASQIHVSDGQQEVVHYVVEDPATGEVAHLRYVSEGVDQEVLDSIAEMSLAG